MKRKSIDKIMAKYRGSAVKYELGDRSKKTLRKVRAFVRCGER